MRHSAIAKVVFVTGTDTGAGKTILTALLLAHLRAQGFNALAAKPFTTGGRGDARLLNSLQDSILDLDEVNPFHFSLPVAPLVAAQEEGRLVLKRDVLRHLRTIINESEVLLIEGAGGLLTPLGKNFTVLDLVQDLNASVLVAAPNRLGVLNQAAMVSQCLEFAEIKKKTMVLCQVFTRKCDRSVITNRVVLADILHKTPVFEMPHFKLRGAKIVVIKKNAEKYSKLLASIWESL